MKTKIELEYEFIEWIEKKECIAELLLHDNFGNSYKGSGYYNNDELIELIELDFFSGNISM